MDQSTGDDLSKPKPEYLTAVPAAEIAGVTAPTFAKHVEPDAAYRSIKGDKTYGLWLRTTAEAFRVERQGGAE